MFVFYNNDQNLDNLDKCSTLAHCFKSYLYHGIPNADNSLMVTVGSRYLLDVFFFIQVYVVLNIVKGK